MVSSLFSLAAIFCLLVWPHQLSLVTANFWTSSFSSILSGSGNGDGSDAGGASINKLDGHRGLPATSDLFTIEPSMKESMDRGREQWSLMEKQANDEYPCWRDATMRFIGQSCKDMTYEKRARTAIALANCHMAQSGLQSFPCSDYTPILSCTQAMGSDTTAFQTYTDFFGHIDNICFYAQHNVFQLSTQAAVNQLYGATVDTASHLQRFTSQASVISERILSVLQQGHVQLSSAIDVIGTQEQERFAKLSTATDTIQAQQTTLLETVQNGTKQLSQAVNDSLELQGLVAHQQMALHDAQTQLLVSAARTRTDLADLKTEQYNAFAAAHNQLDGIRSSAEHLATQQAAVVSSVASATHELNTLAAAQARGFATSTEQLNGLAASHTRLQQSTNDVLQGMDRTHGQLSELDRAQAASFAAARSQLDRIDESQSQLSSRTDELVSHVTATHAQLSELQQQQAASFDTASSKLDGLSASQHAAFASAATQLHDIQSSQSVIQSSQRDVLSTVETAKREVESLKESQVRSFREARDTMADIAKASREAEERVHSLLSQVMGGINRLITLDYSLLAEFFKISSVLFYVISGIMCVILTATDRTAAARFWLLGKLMVTLLIERTYVAMLPLSPDVPISSYHAASSWLRQMYTIIASATLLYHAYTYQNPTLMALQSSLRAEALLHRFGRQLSSHHNGGSNSDAWNNDTPSPSRASSSRDGDIRKYFSAPHRSPTFACGDIDCAHMHSPFTKRKQSVSPVNMKRVEEHKYA